MGPSGPLHEDALSTLDQSIVHKEHEQGKGKYERHYGSDDGWRVGCVRVHIDIGWVHSDRVRAFVKMQLHPELRPVGNL